MRTSSIRLLTLSRSLVIIGGCAVLLAAGCGEEDPVVPSDTYNDPFTEESEDKLDGSTGGMDGSTTMPENPSEAGTESPRDASTVVPVSGKPTDAALPTTDAGLTGAPGVCNEETPHGCYVLQAGSNPKCPAQSPVQASGYPTDQAEWQGCNGIEFTQPFALDEADGCLYEGPNGELANCRCDTGLHWICSCSADLWSGVLQWPNCSPAGGI